MDPFKINIEDVDNGAVSCVHEGKDSQYCEAGKTVKLRWQPTAGWGLQEAHYTDGDGNVTAIVGGSFIMPSKDVTIGATFKRFSLQDWTGKGNAGDSGSRPTLGSDDAGFTYYDTDLKRVVVWDGSGWRNVDGTHIPLTFIGRNASAAVAVFQNNENASEEFPALDIALQYSTDGGVTWNSYTVKAGGDAQDADATFIDIRNGATVMFRGVNVRVGDYSTEDGEGCYLQFAIDGNVAATGDVTSLLNGQGGNAVLDDAAFYSMFQGCTGLTAAPALPATTLAQGCYYYMFQGCTGLTTAPALPATTLAPSCYSYMFQGCTGLTAAGYVAATTSLTQTNCMASMFAGCTHLETTHFASLGSASANIFQNNAAAVSLTIDATTPPTIASSTLTGLKATCKIFVPASAVSAYKSKQYWSARSSYIEAMPS